MARLTLDEVKDLSTRVLQSCGATPIQSDATARSIRDAEADGIRNVGLGYLPTYAEHLLCGKVDGTAIPTLSSPRSAVVLVDAQHGFCHPAFEFGEDHLVAATKSCGIGMMAISHSYSAGVLGWFVERLAQQGLVAMMFANSSSAVSAAGGRRPFFGTNPIAWAAPRQDSSCVVADFSTSVVAWVKVNTAAQAGELIPLGWALDVDGNPTTNAQAGLDGSMAPAAGHKGTALALLVDILAGGITGSNFSFESSSFGDKTGGPPDVGQVIIAIDPTPTAGSGFLHRIETELAALTSDQGVRLPGDQRLAHRLNAQVSGVEVPTPLLDTLHSFLT